jgi:hypothetical protein
MRLNGRIKTIVGCAVLVATFGSVLTYSVLEPQGLSTPDMRMERSHHAVLPEYNMAQWQGRPNATASWQAILLNAPRH